jgi:polyphosphate kinase
VHVGTGNYNSKTARIYTDIGLLTSNPSIGADLTDLFNSLTGYSRQSLYRKLLVAPANMRDRFRELIERETAFAAAGQPARIIAKMNALVDPEIIELLYRASQAGVDIDLIVRGICCLRPNVEGTSERIRVVSIVGRFLEHSRAFYFLNGGEEECYIGSADWMPRNFDRRVEAVVPIEDPELRGRIKSLLDVCLADNRQAWDLDADACYRQRQPGEDPETATHKILLKDSWGRLQPAPAPDQPQLAL